MRVILEVTLGPSSGRKTVLGAFQTLQIGRTEWADFAIAHDGKISSVHFSLETDDAACYIKDLGSRNGTTLNGRPLADRVALKDNDEIVAGETNFRVRIESEAQALSRVPEKPISEATAVPIAANPPPAVVPPPVSEFHPPKRSKVQYALEPCASGLNLCTGSTAEIRPTDLANLLSLKIPLHLIVDPRKLEVKPTDLPAADYLFNWIPPEVAALASPVVVSAESYAEWPSLVEQGWGNDAVMCLFSRYDKPSLMEHLRSCLQAKPKQSDATAGIIGYCWPGVMSMLLAHGMQNFTRRFFTGIDAILLELPDLPEIWQLFGPGPIAKMIDDLGFVRKENEPAKSM
jgi:hypothetical protein